VFGVLKRDGKVYTQIIKNASKQELMPIVRQIIRKRSQIYTDKWKAYDGLVFDGYKHKRINHSKSYSNRRGTHVNGIENFWSFAKRRLAKFSGVSRETFLLHLKECEFGYNHKGGILKSLETFIKLLASLEPIINRIFCLVCVKIFFSRMQICPKTQYARAAERSEAASSGLPNSLMWTHGESHPGFVHAMDACYCYTMGPK
jgi:transposase-like protein